MNEDKDQAARAPANDVGDAAVGEFPDEGAATVSPEERVEALEQELAEAKDRLLRALAETENVRRRAQREREDTLKYAISNFARDLLSPVDNLRRALDSVMEAEIDDPRAKSLLDGVAATERELLATFERNGLKRIDPKGERCHHNFRQAIVEAARTIDFQRQPGAYSDLACRRVFPAMTTLPCAAFEDAFAAVREGRAALAMIPIENSVAGRVADIHHLMPDSGLFIIAEHFERVNHHLLALPGATLASIRTVRSHVQALSQCRKLIRELRLTPVIAADTAGSAAEIKERGDPSVAAIASELAGRIYGLVSLKENIEDAEHNTTRFLIMSREPKWAPRGDPAVTTLVFNVRNVPAALYKA